MSVTTRSRGSFGGLFGELDDRLDHRLEMPVAEHHGAEHHVFGQFLGFGLDHQHGIAGAGHDEVEFALGHFVDRRIEHVLAADKADTRGADRAHEGCAGQGQRCRRADKCQNVRIVLHVMGERGDDHLGLVAPAIGEERTDRAIDQAGDQRLFFGRTTFALEIAAGDAARGIEFFLVVDGERQEIDAFARRLGRDHGREHGGIAIGCDHGTVGLTRHFAGFEGELAPAPVELNAVYIEHLVFLSSVSD